ncbi:hypothetical protein RHSIM_Rhsim04G0178900 [Rhododendron simsii]|uniref:Uncharacterized protein n=1 Tax=Rhododendron simsii TaxID=118357 RepID=A0A834LSM3_RHOSS|nr:hypothetical protein RHSIM_Rhsim04G0178900 [Rhododendron simsii]
MHPYFPFNTRASVVPASRPSPAEDVELAMAINASIQSDMESRPPYADANPISGASTSSNCQSGSMRNHSEIQEGCQSGLMLNQYACSGNVDKIKPVHAKGAKLEVPF